MASATERREQLKAVYREASACVRCPQLAESRTQVVFGAGNADADLMFVGEAPGRSEDEQGIPFIGAAGKLLTQLLEEVGLSRDEVFVTNALNCRPPGNRDPLPQEIANCQDWLHAKLDLIQPKVVCTLGNFATKLLRGETTSITGLHGQPEVRVVGPRTVTLVPLYHPAAALYTRSLLDSLRADFAQIPALLAAPAPPQPVAAEAVVPEPEPVAEIQGDRSRPPDDQLGLF